MKTIFRTTLLTACAVIASGVGNISYAAVFPHPRLCGATRRTAAFHPEKPG
jgi:hypothetical protein